MDEQRNEYRTGRTEPRRKHNGIIALLLILVIFLCGLVSVLGIMNIRLFHLLDKKKQSAPLSFSRQEELLPTQSEDTVVFAGMTIQEIPAVYQSVHELPAGLYIAHIQEGSAAQLAGILAGDVQTVYADRKVDVDVLDYDNYYSDDENEGFYEDLMIETATLKKAW